MKPVNLDQARNRLAEKGTLYDEFLRVPELSVGLYRLPAGSNDPQEPHNEDEVYYVIGGSARIQIEDDSNPVGPGDVIFVARRQQHYFFDIREDLELLVFFAPAET